MSPYASHEPTTNVVIIPTYNEIDNIARVLDAVLAAADADVLVVDDSSPDGTARAVRAHSGYGARVHLVVRPEKDGLGGAYRAGFVWALDRGYERMVQMDADLSHPPDRVPALLDALDDHDVAVGSRYVPGGGVRDWGAMRRLISWLGNAYVRIILALPVKDATAGFKAFTAEALEAVGVMTSHSNGYCFQIETTLRAARHRQSIIEVPITFSDRTRGTSKMSGRIVVEAVVRVLAWRIGELRHPRARMDRVAT